MEIENAVIARLACFGYVVTDQDMDGLGITIKKVEQTICNFCNLVEVPKGLFYVEVDMAAGEFLREKKTFDPDSLSYMGLGEDVKQIQEGDTNVVFAVGSGEQTAEQRLDTLIEQLTAGNMDELKRYRKARWQ